MCELSITESLYLKAFDSTHKKFRTVHLHRGDKQIRFCVDTRDLT